MLSLHALAQTHPNKRALSLALPVMIGHGKAPSPGISQT